MTTTNNIEEEPTITVDKPTEPEEQTAEAEGMTSADMAPNFADTVRNPIKLPVTLEDKQRFFKSFMSDTPYVEAFPIFGDKSTITFASIPVSMHNKVLEQVKLDQEAGLAQSDDSYFIRFAAYRCAECLVSLDGKTFDVPLTKPDLLLGAEGRIVQRANALLSWSGFKLTVVLDVFSAFENKVQRLSQMAPSKDFWTAVL